MILNTGKISVPKSLLKGIYLSLVCIALQYSSMIFELNFSIPINLRQTGPFSWETPKLYLTNEAYYLSVGRPRGACELKVNEKTVSRTIGPIPGTRENLLLGGGFTPEASGTKIGIICSRSEGFSAELSHTPALLKYKLGLVLQIWRSFTELIIGPLFSLLLFFLLIERSILSSNRNTLPLGTHYLMFSLSALLYSCSLAHYTRLFVEDRSASVLHAILKTSFLWCFYNLSVKYHKKSLLVTYSYIFIVSTLIFVGVFYPSGFDTFYKYFYFVFSILTTVPLFNSFKPSKPNRTLELFRSLAAMCFFVQVADLIVMILGHGVHIAPAFVTVTTVLVGVLVLEENRREKHIENAKNNTFLLLYGLGSIEDRLRAVGEYIISQTNFNRGSVYLDSFILGLADKPKKSFIRLFESGYLKDTEKDNIITFEDRRGLVMQSILVNGKPKLAFSEKDHTWFTNIPFGSHAVINLSNNESKSEILMNESFELIQALHPILDRIQSQLIDLGAKMSFALESLRLIRGDGEWKEEIGCIFLDINSYDDYMRKYRDPFGSFVGKIYLPSLCQRVRHWAVREGGSAGDSVYLLCIKDLVQDSSSISIAIQKTITEISRFIAHEGAQMCIQNGYEPLQLQIGFSKGTANILSDSFQVRTNGNVVNEAARIQKAAPPGCIYGQSELVTSWDQVNGIEYGPEIEDIVKTKRLKVRQIFFNKEHKNVA